MNVINKQHLVNEEIREKEIRLIDSDGTQLGIMPTKKALEIAESKQLDLVLIAPQAKPPVCKIMDYGKFIYEQQKKERKQRKSKRLSMLRRLELLLTSTSMI